MSDDKPSDLDDEPALPAELSARAYRFKPGERFGAWTVLRFSHVDEGGRVLWLCRCDCGTERPVEGSRLNKGESVGCGKCDASRAERRRRREQEGETADDVEDGSRPDRNEFGRDAAIFVSIVGVLGALAFVLMRFMKRLS